MSIRTTNESIQIRLRKATPSFWSWVLSFLVLLLTLHPIIAADFWWQVARGRAVWEGHFAPSHLLLAFEQDWDADWLGGLPWYLLYSAVGPSILSFGIAIFAVILANLIGSRGGFTPMRIGLICIGFAAAREAWSPTPALIDVVGVIVTWNLAGALHRQPRWTLVAELLFCVLFWANLATLPILGFLVTAVRMNLVERNSSRRLSPRSQLGLLALMFLAGSVTPRGLFTFWDSFRLLLPWTSTDLGTLAAAGIMTQFRGPLPVEIIAFVLLFAIYLYQLFRKSLTVNSLDGQDLAMALAVAILAGSSKSNIGPTAILLLLLENHQLKSHPNIPDAIRTAPHPANPFRYGAFALFALIATSVAAGYWPASPTRLGWGMSPQLESELMEFAMADIKLGGTAYCSGVRESGLLAWLRPGKIRPADVASRAILSGRLQDHVRIGWDLAHGWRDQHRRSDGTWGGWLRPLQERQTELLFISSDDLAVIRMLEPSFWKPLAIDTPCVPYAFADTPLINRRIVNVASLLDLVEMGEWTYTAPPPSGTGAQWDLWGWVTRRHDLQVDLRQARILKSMKRPIAALKVLKYGLQRGNTNAQQEFREIQLSFAYAEFLETGQATSWRMLAYLASGGSRATLSGIDAGRQTLPSCLPRDFQTAVLFYSQNNLEKAKSALPDGNPKSLYALAQIGLEEGNPKQAARCIHRLNSKFPCTPESKASRHVLAKLPD